ncbi:MAG: nucleotidyltransferase [Corynebacterium sp.]|nr:nucleotidyltransferase [Corynebacterium sp.]
MSSVINLFEHTLQNLKVANANKIKARRDEITRLLNKQFRNSDSATSNRLMVGSWGRHTAINGISDLDMIYILPPSLRSELHKTGGPQKALQQTKSAIADHYSSTSISVDRLVVVVQFSDFKFEIQPCFENDDDSFEYPDTYRDSWKQTNPRAEIDAMRELNEETNGTARALCRLARAWKEKNNVPMNGLLIDTLVWRFFGQSDAHRDGTLPYDKMVLKFFAFLSQLPRQDHWNALGSQQNVTIHKNFQRKAKKAVQLCEDAMDAEGNTSMYSKWRKVFGRFIPADANSKELEPAERYQDTEEFIEDLYQLNIQYELKIDCTVTQDGFRPMKLRDMLQKNIWLRPSKKLHFRLASANVPEPYELRWKVLNRGEEAERRNEIRGQIIKGKGKHEHREDTKFRGDHCVECYAIQDGVVVARGRIDVPIRA